MSQANINTYKQNHIHEFIVIVVAIADNTAMIAFIIFSHASLDILTLITVKINYRKDKATN